MILSTRINGKNAKCDRCGELFYRPPAHLAKAKRGLNFCSRKCSHIHHTGLNHPNGTWQSLSRPCETCGKEITKRGKRRFCSKECVVILPRKQLDSTCSECKKPIKRIAARIKPTTFCSKDCQNKYHSKRLKGLNNPRYKNGDFVGSRKKQYEKYEGFTKAKREYVRQRDGNKCFVCKKTAVEHGMNMHVHHIDYNKKNNKLHNLICVCKYCHGKIHGDEDKWLKILLKVSERLQKLPPQLTIFKSREIETTS